MQNMPTLIAVYPTAGYSLAQVLGDRYGHATPSNPLICIMMGASNALRYGENKFCASFNSRLLVSTEGLTPPSHESDF